MARTHRGWRIFTIGLAVACFALALCGTTAQAGRTTVDIVDFAFKPATVRIAKGSSVRFSNSSGVQHTATRGGSFDTGRIKPGKSVAVRFGQKGTFAYHCTIHSFMKGKVVVE